MNLLFLLSSFGLAISCLAQQCSKPTGGSNMHLRDWYITKSTFEDGANVSFICAPGYASAGGLPQITCSAGEWSTPQLKCERIKCGALPDVNKARIEYKVRTEFGDIAEISCREGYILVGNAILKCEADGWKGAMPTCDELKCDPPDEIEDGRFSPKKDSYGFADVVRYSCNQDLILQGARKLVCGERGLFSPGPPICVRGECKNPVIRNGVLDSGSQPSQKYKATVTFKCKPKFIMIGNPTVTCDKDGRWSPVLPLCTRDTSNGNALVGLLTGALLTIPVLLVQNYWI